MKDALSSRGSRLLAGFCFLAILAAQHGCSKSAAPKAPEAEGARPKDAPGVPSEEAASSAAAEAPATQAEAKPAPATPFLGYRFSAGTESVYHQILTRQIELESEARTTRNLVKVELDFALSVAEASPDGGAEGGLDLRRVRFSGDEQTRFDSQTPEAARRVRPEVAQIVSDLLDASLPVIIDGDGALANGEEIERRVGGLIDRAKPQHRRNFRSRFEEFIVGANLSKLVAPHRLPNETPREGMTWEAPYPMSLSSFGDVDLPARYRLESVENGEAQLSFRAEFGPSMGDAPLALNTTTTLQSIVAHGTARFDAEGGRMLESRARHEIETKVMVSGVPSFSGETAVSTTWIRYFEDLALTRH